MALTQDHLRWLLNYDPSSGVFVWKNPTSIRCHVGQRAGSVMSNGYVSISIGYTRYYAHRLAWLYVYGSFPREEIDHANRKRSDNRICNLREATRLQNLHNTGPWSSATSRFKGVDFNKKTGKWRARIRSNGMRRYLGEFGSSAEAAKAYQAAAVHAFGSFSYTEKIHGV